MFKLRAIHPFFKERQIEAFSLSQAVDKFKEQVGVYPQYVIENNELIG